MQEFLFFFCMNLTGCLYGLVRITEVRKKEFLSGDLGDLELIIRDINFIKDAFKFFKVDCLKDLLKEAMRQTKEFVYKTEEGITDDIQLNYREELINNFQKVYDKICSWIGDNCNPTYL